MYAKNRIVSTLQIVDYIKLKEETERGREKRDREKNGGVGDSMTQKKNK